MRHALVCFAQFGYEATTYRMIAEGTGLTPAAIQHHFDQKKDLMFAIHQRVVDRFLGPMTDASRNDAPCAVRVQRLLVTLHSLIASDREVVAFGLVAREETRRFAELRGLTDDSDARFARLLDDIAAEAVYEGGLRAEDEGRLAGALARRGFGASVVAQVTREVLAEVPEVAE